VEIDGSGTDMRMSQVGLDDAQVDPVFEQVGGEGMPQGMDGGWFVDATLAPGQAEGLLRTCRRHVLGGRGLIGARACGSGKDPDWMAVGGPVAAQQAQVRFEQRDVAVLLPLTAAHMEYLALAVDIGDLQGNALAHPQAAGVDGGAPASRRRRWW